MALAATAFLSSYIVRVPVMWRQAPITAAIVVASGIEKHSETASIEIGLRRVAEVLFGCLMGLGVTWLMSKDLAAAGIDHPLDSRSAMMGSCCCPTMMSPRWRCRSATGPRPSSSSAITPGG